MLRDMWGEERFRDVIQEYMRRWNGKHPTPWDFFNTLEDVTGESLGWLIRPWFFEYGAPDLAIRSVEREGDSYRIAVSRVGANPVFIDLAVTYADGNTEMRHEPVSVWLEGSTEHVIQVPARGNITQIVLGNDDTPDANLADNRYSPGS